jgi:steroid delta-isomerase-like uncharacterized protein
MQALDVARQYFDAWNRHDAAGINSLFNEDGFYSDPTTGGPLRGEAIGGYASGLWSSFPDLAFEIVSADQTDDEHVAAQWVMRGTNHGSMLGLPPTGKPVELPGADFVTVRDGRIDAVVGYFDSGLLPRQLGLQVLVQPHTIGPFTFGGCAAVQSGKQTKPGAISITSLYSRDEQDQQQVSNFSRQIATEMLGMPGFIGWTGVVVGDRMLTITAWEEPEQARRLLKEGTHREAMQVFFADNSVALGGWTSVWAPAWINAYWSRCDACGRMVNHEKLAGLCECGAALPEQKPWW